WSGSSPSNESEADTTSMVLHALSPYAEQAEVKEAIDKAIAWLVSQQTPNGGFIAWGAESVESVAQVIIGVTSLKMDPRETPFARANGDLITNLLSFYDDERNLFPGDFGDQFPTEQAFQALLAYKQFLIHGQSRLFDLSAIPLEEL